MVNKEIPEVQKPNFESNYVTETLYDSNIVNIRTPELSIDFVPEQNYITTPKIEENLKTIPKTENKGRRVFKKIKLK